MTVIGLDDIDSRTLGVCTTYLATLIAEIVEVRGRTVERRLLVRLNPAVEHKTRGNATLATHADLPAGAASDLAREKLDHWAVLDDDRTGPDVVVTPESPDTVSTAVADFARDAVRDFHDLDDAVALAERSDFLTEGWHGGQGRVGAFAAVDAWAAFDEWTYEHISYREFHRCGTPHKADVDSIFNAADAAYPGAWDTAGRKEGGGAYMPNAPEPILHDIRGDDTDAVCGIIAVISSEPVDRSATFRTNRGTDAHLRDGIVSDLRDSRAYRVAGTIASDPRTRQGGHVSLNLEASDTVVAVAASEPTKCFRSRVWALRVNGAVTTCGEVGDGTLGLEKFAVRDLVRTEPAAPVCPNCERTIKSAGRDQGYRCHDCGTDVPDRAGRVVDHGLEPDWYEVPPCARRHIAKLLVRGGFDAATHPER